jgi:hypothetical protein
MKHRRVRVPAGRDRVGEYRPSSSEFGRSIHCSGQKTSDRARYSQNERSWTMAKRLVSGLLLIVVAAFAVSLASCSGGADTKKTITYKCLSSSCDATVVCNEGDPVPDHCGKHMIR